jgi:hypothetical protein
MKIMGWLLGLLLMLTSGCDTLVDVFRPTEESPTFVEVGEGYSAVIFPASAAAASGAEYLLNDEDITYWTPTAADVELAEQAFQAEVVSRLAETPTDDSVLYYVEEVNELIPDYNRQYFGFVQDGQRRIYGQYFCPEIDGWGETLMMVEDGGACVVEFIYDLNTDTLLMFIIHGEA